MLVFQGNEYRNLEEQVQKNKEDIARHYEIDRAMANLGINIVGQVETEADLPSAVTYAGNYGDTYAVGNKAEVEAGTASYSYYVWVGPDLNAGQPYDHWLNVGRISIVGPQGERGLQGERGPQGERGTSISAGASGNYYGTVNGDLYLVTSGTPSSLGNVYVYAAASGQWVLQGNIRGPQGPQGVQGLQGERGPQGQQGPKGETGDVGGFINIAGIVATSDSLPLPSELGNLTVAYLVGASAPYDLYVQVGSTSATAVWVNAGPFNAATLVTVNGAGQNVWNADTKVGVTDYATKTKAGLVSPRSRGFGIGWLGELYLLGASQKEIAAKGSGDIAITPSMLDYAVKVGITTNTETLTDEEKDAACGWLGATRLYKHTISGFVGGTGTINIFSITLISTSNTEITGASDLDLHYTQYVVTANTAYGKVVNLLQTGMNEITMQFHSRPAGGEVETVVLDASNITDNVQGL